MALLFAKTDIFSGGVKFLKRDMGFPGSKPNAYEIMKASLSGFTPEEIEILDGKDCFVSHMYSFLLEEASRTVVSSDLNLNIAKIAMNKLFYSRGDEVRDPSFQKNLFIFLNGILHRC